MGNIIVAFNRTTNSYYVNYAKVDYSVTYTDNSNNLTTTASVKLDFYIKPDNFTYSLYTKDSLTLGVQPEGESLISYDFTTTETYGKTVYSNVYNLVGSKTFSVTYDSTSSKKISISALYQNSATARFSPFYMPKNSSGGYQSYTYSSTDANVITLPKRFSITANTAPTSVTVSPSIFNSSVTISYTGATAGTANSISNYSIYSRSSVNGSSYSSWTNIGTSDSTSYTYTPSVTAGYYMQFKVIANSSISSDYSSDFSDIVTARKNSSPSAVSGVSLDKTEYTQGESLTISYSGASDVDGNLLSYEIYYSVDSGSWVLLTTATSSSYTFTPSIANDLSYIKFRVRAKDSFGETSNYTESNTIRRNDYTGINICTGSSYQKAEIYVCEGSSFNKAMVYVCSGGIFAKGESI